jgi:O-antigen ligase
MEAMPGRRPARDLPVLAFALLLPLAYDAVGAAPHWTARAALLRVAAATGVGPLVSLVRRKDGPAIAAVLFVAVCTVSAAVSDNARLAILGPFALSGGTLFVVAIVALWASGRRLDGASLPSLHHALLVAAAVNAVVGLVQLRVDLGLPALGLFDGRPTGLLGSPIWLGMLTSAAVPLGAALLDGSRRWLGVAALVVLAGGVQASGSRTSLLVLAGVVVWSIRRSSVITTALILASVGVGALLAAGLSATATGGTATDRFAVAQASQLQPRLDTWSAAGRAITRRPLLGWGPGRLYVAISPDRSLETARAEGPERLFTDAHDLLIEYGATTGLLGLGTLLSWLALAGRRASGPLAAFALAAAAGSLTEPQYVTVLPLAALALGASQRRDDNDASARLGLWPIVPVAIAAVAATVLLVGDLSLQKAEIDFRTEDAARAAQFLAPWPQPHATEAKVLFFRGKTARDAALTARAIVEQGEAVRRDPADPAARTLLADYQLEAGQELAAERNYRAALARNPWSSRAMSGLAVVAAHRCRPAEVDALVRRMELVGSLPQRARQLELRCP